MLLAYLGVCTLGTLSLVLGDVIVTAGMISWHWKTELVRRREDGGGRRPTMSPPVLGPLQGFVSRYPVRWGHLSGKSGRREAWITSMW